jgi:hypothetical protein
MPSLGHVDRRSTPVLHQEEDEVFLGLGEVLGVHGAQEFILGDGRVKVVDELDKETLSHGVIKALFVHNVTLPVLP